MLPNLFSRIEICLRPQRAASPSPLAYDMARRVGRHSAASCIALVVASFMALFVYSTAAAQAIVWRNVETLDVTAINADIVADKPTVDVGLYYPSNLDEAFVAAVPLSGLVKEFREAKKIFGVAGVQLNLLWVKSGEVDPKYFSLHSTNTERQIPKSAFQNMYAEQSRNPSVLSDHAREAFETMVEVDKHNDRTVYLLVLQNVYMTFFEDLDGGRNWAPRMVNTGGLSFPSYMYGDQMPRRVRGVITLTKHDPKHHRIIAHEIGHKIMNVSHEYKERGPEHEIIAEGGLMLYGGGTDIPAGEAGRWHRERLHKSPYIYRRGTDGAKKWNPDYVAGGFYYDALYENYVVEFK